MKTSFPSARHDKGFALFLTLTFVVISLIAFASIMYWMQSSAKQVTRNEIFTMNEAAAEAATEKVFAQMERDFLYQALNTPDAYTGLLPTMTNWPVQFVFSDTNGNTGQISIYEGLTNSTLQTLGSQYANLLGWPQPVTITAIASGQGQAYDVPATVSQVMNFVYIPAFQFAIFYNIDLEIDPGKSMPIRGSVFSNAGIWSGNGNPTYSSIVEAANTVDTSGTDPFCSNYTDGGTPAANFTYAGPPTQPVSHVNPLVIPIGADNSSNQNSSTNVHAILDLPPVGANAPNDIAYVTTNLTYDFNGASLVVSNAPYGTNGNNIARNTNCSLTVYFQDPASSFTAPASSHWSRITNDFYIVTNVTLGTSFATNHIPFFQTTNMAAIQWTNPVAKTNRIFYAGFTFLTNVAFYDYRESDTVQAVQIDVAKFRLWLTNGLNGAVNTGTNWNYALANDTGHGINSIYVYNGIIRNGVNGGSQGGGTLPAVRLVNGSRLPNTTNVIGGASYYGTGLTVVTPQAAYIAGDYNVQRDGGAASKGTGNTDKTYPAAVMADAITVLSDNWPTADYTAGTSFGSRDAAATTINCACLEGIVASTGTNYSGGVENFIRLLEDWSNIQLTYNGSIMVMFTSEYATNKWQPTGNYYNAPTRVWGFDTNFLIQSHLPPLTPQFRGVIRNSWSAY